MWGIYLYTKKKYSQGWLFGFFFAFGALDF
jgi:hypothetical protein